MHHFKKNFYRLITTFHVCWQCKNKSFFHLKFLCASHLKIKHFELPPCLQNWTYEKKIDWDAHLMSCISCWLLLVFVIWQISNQISFLYTLYMYIIVQNTSKNLPLQLVSSKGNLQVVDKFRKNLSCFYAQGGNVGVWSLK